MTAALLIGAAAGTGLLAAVWAFIPPRTDLAAAVADHDRNATASHPRTDRNASSTRRDRIGRSMAVAVSRTGLSLDRLRSDLTLLDRAMEAHLLAKVGCAAAGLAIPSVAVAAVAAAGINVPVTLTAGVAVAVAVGFFFLPDLSVAAEANRRRDELRHALASYLDLVSMALAGGRGVPEALPAATRIGRGWAFELIGDTIGRARYSGITPWDALATVGQQVDVTELRDLGSALSLVADDGAKVKESLRARAATARTRELTAAEGDAEKASDSIRYAHLALGLAFLLFLGFPAVSAVLAI